MGFKVVDSDKRCVPGQRECLRRRHSDKQRSDETGADSARNCIDALLVNTCVIDRPTHNRVDRFEVGTARHLRNNATELGMYINLARHHR